MKKAVLTVVICAVLAAVTGTAGYYIGSNSRDDISAAIPHEEMPVTPEPPAETSAPEPAEEITYVTRSDVSAAAEGVWTTVGEYGTDLTGDGQVDTLTIYTAAGRDDDGLMGWDDGQNWVVEIRDAQGGFYALLSKYVQHGNVYADVFEEEGQGKAVSVIVATGSGMSLKRYKYSSSGFVESKIVEDAGLNVFYSSIPWYR